VAGRWNHNIHYHPAVLSAIDSAHHRRVLDVGCGEGILTRELRTVAATAVGIDLDSDSLLLASQSAESGVHYVRGDVLAAPFTPGSFDVVASVATLHHVDAAAGLAAMAGLIRPGGTLVVVGLARSRLPKDVLWELAAVVGTRLMRLRRQLWEHSAPTVWPPPLTYDETARVVAATLPGAQFRRRLLWRYTVVWNKPMTTLDSPLA
jgi:2-polyprenyl-3-methyl-5-hydroxy-6-metoxy-1,4-benzoquinol methylase